MNIHPNSRNIVQAFNLMYTAKILDDEMINMLKQGKAYFHMSSSGHEAIQAAVALLLNVKKDWIYPYYRDLALCLGLGMSIRDILLGFLGKKKDI